MKKIYVKGHLGLGDHLLCIGLYRVLAESAKNIIIPVRSYNLSSLRFFLRDLPNVYFFSYPKTFTESSMYILSKTLPLLRFEELRLGHWGINFVSNGTRFDASFYRQANIPFRFRWDGFTYIRDMDQEFSLFRSYDVKPGKYIFLHEDRSRRFEINRNFIRPKMKIVEPKISGKRIPIAHYRLLMENAAENHLIESSFAAFCDSIEVSGKRFAHRYSRPEAARDPFHEFSYRHDWKVYINGNR